MVGSSRSSSGWNAARRAAAEIQSITRPDGMTTWLTPWRLFCVSRCRSRVHVARTISAGSKGRKSISATPRRKPHTVALAFAKLIEHTPMGQEAAMATDQVSPRYARYGVCTSKDAQIAKAFEAGLRRWGWPEKQFEEVALPLYRDHGSHGGSYDDLARSFSYCAARGGIPREKIDGAFSVYSVIAERGPEAIAPLPAPGADLDAKRHAQ